MWTRMRLVINVTLIGVTCGRMMVAWIRKRPRPGIDNSRVGGR
jgi:hypothetical protein